VVHRGSGCGFAAGNIVRVDHAGGVATLYAGLDVLQVIDGQQVDALAMIGTLALQSDPQGCRRDSVRFSVLKAGTVPVDPGVLYACSRTSSTLRYPAAAGASTWAQVVPGTYVSSIEHYVPSCTLNELCVVVDTPPTASGRSEVHCTGGYGPEGIGPGRSTFGTLDSEYPAGPPGYPSRAATIVYPGPSATCWLQDTGPTASGHQVLDCYDHFNYLFRSQELPFPVIPRSQAQHLRGGTCTLLDTAPTPSGREELHCADDPPGEVVLPWAPIDRSKAQTFLTDVDADGYDDLCVLLDTGPTASGSEELHCLSGRTGLRTLLLEASAQPYVDRARAQQFLVDADGDGLADLCVLIDTPPTASGREELHCRSGESGYTMTSLDLALDQGFPPRTRAQTFLT